MVITLARGAVARKVCECARTRVGAFLGGAEEGRRRHRTTLEPKRVGDPWMTQSVPDGGSLMDDSAISAAGGPTCAWVTSG